MCIDMLHRSNKNNNYRCLVVTPYENQVRLIFMRLKELIDASPLLSSEVEKFTFSPFLLSFKNGSAIMGFTTGAASGSGGASIRGQKGDYIYMDEVDYMHDNDFDTVMTIAAERSDIGIFMSSTPTGRRGKFYQCCTDPALGFTEHHHPSTHNPAWNEQMEADFRAQLSDQGYIHEILAEFGSQDTGVFDKEKLDEAVKRVLYHYDNLTLEQQRRMDYEELEPIDMRFDGKPVPPNPFRTMGVDWDKYQASSSIIILDYDVNREKFMVIKRIEVPRAEYSYDKAVNTVVELNDKYNPSWIFADTGAAEYQIERLHIIGDQRPSTGLKNKVVGWQFSENVEIINPITKTVDKKPMKPFMVNQLQTAVERDKFILSPFDEVLYKQLIDYEVVGMRKQSGIPIFTDKNDHFVDALGLSYLAFVLHFPELVNTIKEVENTTKVEHVGNSFGMRSIEQLLRDADNPFDSDAKKPTEERHKGDLRGDRPEWVKVSRNQKSINRVSSWGNRGNNRAGMTRSMW